METGRIERGEILSVDGEKYVISSLDRAGIETPPLAPLHNETYSVGDKVYFLSLKMELGKLLARYKT